MKLPEGARFSRIVRLNPSNVTVSLHRKVIENCEEIVSTGPPMNAFTTRPINS